MEKVVQKPTNKRMKAPLTLSHLKTTACAKRSDNLHLFEEKQEKPKI